MFKQVWPRCPSWASDTKIDEKKHKQSIGHRRTLLILVRQQIKSSYDVSSWSLSKRPSAIKVSRASRSKINKQLLHGLGCLLSLTSKLELEMEKCKINNRVLPLHIRIASLPSSNLEGHFGLSGKYHILFIWLCHSEIMQRKSSMSLWWCSQHTCPEMGVYMVYP